MRILFINNLFPPDYVGGAEISAFDKAYDALPNLPLTAASARVVLP